MNTAYDMRYCWLLGIVVQYHCDKKTGLEVLLTPPDPNHHLTERVKQWLL
jgi:hypothetical protein